MTAGLALSDLLRIGRAVKDLGGYPTVDQLGDDFEELVGRYPDRICVRQLGSSAQGEPIRMFSISGGERDALVVGGVHPNEAVGFHTVGELARTLLESPDLLPQLGFSWHLVPNIDPDGTRLNHGWFDRPGDRAAYAEHFYRPAPDRQPEWTFPITYRDLSFQATLPETRALMAAIVQVRPDLYVSLHNGETGGVYFYLGHALPELHPFLQQLPAEFGISLQVGEAEAPFIQTLADGIFRAGSVSEGYDHYDGLGQDPTRFLGGSSSTEYAAGLGALPFICEVPYWTSPTAGGTELSTETFGELCRRSATALSELVLALTSVLDRAERYLPAEAPLTRAVRTFVPLLAAQADQDLAGPDDTDHRRAATVAEVTGRDALTRMFAVRYGGMLRRALHQEAAGEDGDPELGLLRAEIDVLFGTWTTQPDPATATAVPVRDLVAVQLVSILAVANQLGG